MATETVEFNHPTGETVTFSLFPIGSDTASFSSVSATERTNNKTVYRGDVSSPTAGWYRLYAVGSTKSSWLVYLTNTARTAYAADYPPEVISGQRVLADCTAISGDSTAADNLEAVLDGTGGVTLMASAFTLTTPITANATQISGDSTAADNAEAFFDGTGYAGTNNVIPTVTNTGTLAGAATVVLTDGSLTAAKIAADAITAAKVASDVGTEIGAATLAALGTGTWATAIPWNAAWDAEIESEVTDALNAYDPPTNTEMEARTLVAASYATAAAVSSVAADVTTLLGRITASLFSGITSLAQWLGLLAGKQTGNTTARTELRATGGGSGTFDETADSLEALRDRGDAAWITATGFSTLDAAGVRTALGLASANLDTQLGAIDDYLDTEIAAIKAKTDNLPSDPADQSAVETAITNATASLATASALAAVAADLPTRITKNTALAAFSFAMFSSTDHATPATGLTVTAQRSIDGAAFANCANAVSELSGGVYLINLAASDLNGDVITLKFSATGADTQFATITTQPT